MALSANKGEWSEVYVHFKLLADGKLISGDAELNRLANVFFPILQIMRLEGENKEYVYKLSNDGYNVFISQDDNLPTITISRDKFAKMAQVLLSHIKSSKETTFSDNEIEHFMSDVKMFKVKAEGKADIRMIIHDLRTDQTTSLGYSIKLKLGADSTLLNPNNDGTNFLYAISGDLSNEQIIEINTLKNIYARISKLNEYGCRLSYLNVVNPVLRNNLLLLDADINKIIAYCLLGYYSHRAVSSTVKDVTTFVSYCNPCLYPNVEEIKFYEHKIKQFLIIFALGMTANTPWNGRIQANGGYIVVKEDGDIVCYHFYDRNQLEDYLFENTYFDTPSTSRHNHGSVIKDDLTGQLYMKLNIQIRFIGGDKKKWHSEPDYLPMTDFID